MIPILFEHNEISFTSNGIGRLSEAISCKVTEELNGVYELEMVYPVSGRHYNDLIFDRIIYATHDDSKTPEPFDIYRKTEPLDGKVTIYARHISYRLNNIFLEPFDAGSCTALFAGIVSHSINANPFTFYNTVSKTADFESNRPMSVRELLCGTGEMCVPQLYGGDYEWKGFTVYHRERRGQDTSIELRYGKNIIDLSRDIDDSQSYGAVIPFWLSSDGMELAVLPNWIVSKDGATSNKIGLLDLSHEFDIFPELEDLETMAAQALRASDKPIESLSVSFYELWQTEEYEHYAILQRAYMGDNVAVIDPELGINTTLRVIKTVYDCLLDRCESMDLGKPSEPFSVVLQHQMEETVLNIAPTKSAMQQAIEYATQLITGGLGGHLVIGTDADGNPNELLIMDTTDKQTAVNVLRLNLNGIGFSTTGYNGPFTTAWTISSHFVADFITTGNLNASLLTVGVLTDSHGNFRLDLERGSLEAVLSSLKLITRATHEGEADVEQTVDEIATAAVNSTNVSNALTQEIVFNKLTKNRTIQGFFIDDLTGDIYINLTAINASGILQVYNPTTQEETLYINGNTGEVRIFPTQLMITSSKTLQQYVDDEIDLNGMSESDVINILTDNPDLQGIFITQGGRLYVSWEYAKGGTLRLGGNGNNLGVFSVYGYDSYRDEDIEIANWGSNGLDVYRSLRLGSDTCEIRGHYQDPTSGSYALAGTLDLASGDGSVSLLAREVLNLGTSDHPNAIRVFDNYIDIDHPIKLNNLSVGPAISGQYNCLTLGSDGRTITRNYISGSSKRYKHVGREVIKEDVDNAYKIKVYLARYKEGYLAEGDQRTGETYPMFVAEQMYEYLPIAVDIGNDGKPETWNHRVLIPFMFQMIKDQKEEIDFLNKKVSEQEERLTKLEALVAKLGL